MKSTGDLSTKQNAQRQAPKAERPTPITVVVADDHPVTRRGLTAILNSQEDIKVVAEAANGEEACKVYDQLLPDVLMLDLRLPKKDGLQVLLELMSRRVSRPCVIIMTTYDCEQDIFQAARAGAKAFLVKVAGAQQIREAVRRAAEGETFFSPEIGLKLAEALSYPELSKREIQVLQHVACGESNKEIGCALYVCEGTIKYHIRSILRKLNAIGRAEAIAIAARRGLVYLGQAG
jgi:two-component system, NarL family, response regulator